MLKTKGIGWGNKNSLLAVPAPSPRLIYPCGKARNSPPEIAHVPGNINFPAA